MSEEKKEKSAYSQLTNKQRSFVDAYMGEACGSLTEAARLAGYKGSDATLAVAGHRNISRPEIFAAIQELQSYNPLVATREERLITLTSMFRNKSLEPKDRLKALDQLSKACGDYIHKLEVSGPQGSPIQTQSKLDLSTLSPDELKVLLKALGEK